MNIFFIRVTPIKFFDKIINKRAVSNYKRTSTLCKLENNPNEPIVNLLLELGDYEKVNNDRIRSEAYYKAAFSIQSYPNKIIKGKDVADLPGVGKKTVVKISEFLDKGFINSLEIFRKDEKLNAQKLLTTVHGVGPVAARNYVETGITTIEQLKQVPNLPKAQAIGLKYYEDINVKMPREEVSILEKQLIDIINDNQVELKICGSYRRGETHCSDIDVVITDYDVKRKKKSFLKEIVTKLKSEDFITDTISLGSSKFLGICKALTKNGSSNKILHRRLDIIFVPPELFAIGLLHFTGDYNLNKLMRLTAKQKGMILSEKGLALLGPNGKPGLHIETKTEKDVFDALNMAYIEPKTRRTVIKKIHK